MESAEQYKHLGLQVSERNAISRGNAPMKGTLTSERGNRSKNELPSTKRLS